MRVAFYGRVSTDDAQDPSLSIPRQLGKCDQVLEPIGEKVSLTYWDVESGRKALEQRGSGKRDWTDEVSVPRLGGLPELLASAKAGALDAVIVESIDRLSRMTADGTRIERELEEHDVALFAADEPLNSSAAGFVDPAVRLEEAGRLGECPQPCQEEDRNDAEGDQTTPAERCAQPLLGLGAQEQADWYEDRRQAREQAPLLGRNEFLHVGD